MYNNPDPTNSVAFSAYARRCLTHTTQKIDSSSHLLLPLTSHSTQSTTKRYNIRIITFVSPILPVTTIAKQKLSRIMRLSFSLLSLYSMVASSEAFTPTSQIVNKSCGCTSTTLFGAFDKRNKQADLLKKMADAKKQRELDGGEAVPVTTEAKGKAKDKLSDEEMKKQNDLKRFQELLDSEAATVNYNIGGDNYKTQQQEEEDIDAGQKGADRLFEGDPAPVEPFEDLLTFSTGNALGKNGASRVVPWLNKNLSKQTDFLIVVTDPREKSSELRSALKNMSMLLTPEILSRLIVINADSPGETRRFLKKNDIDNINVYCDEKREWMRQYTVLGEKRWAMCSMVLKDGRVAKLVRELDVELVTQVIKSSIKSMKMESS